MTHNVPVLQAHLMEEVQEAVNVHGHPRQHVRGRLDLVLQVFQVGAQQRFHQWPNLAQDPRVLLRIRADRIEKILAR